MEKAKRARKAETPKQPSLCLRLRAPYLYPDQLGHSCLRRSISIRRRAGPMIYGGIRPRDYCATIHSTMWSATAINVAGTSSPSALATLRFMKYWNLVGCSTGSSLALSPFNILSTKTAVR
jgi:hypothetical protein